MKYFFHAGETEIDKGSSANLYDAILLNTTRIGMYLCILNSAAHIHVLQDTATL